MQNSQSRIPTNTERRAKQITSEESSAAAFSFNNQPPKPSLEASILAKDLSSPDKCTEFVPKVTLKPENTGSNWGSMYPLSPSGTYLDHVLMLQKMQMGLLMPSVPMGPYLPLLMPAAIPQPALPVPSLVTGLSCSRLPEPNHTGILPAIGMFNVNTLSPSHPYRSPTVPEFMFVAPTQPRKRRRNKAANRKKGPHKGSDTSNNH